jgi:hypothetical protein
MLVFDKDEVRNELNIEDIYNLLMDWGGEPEYTNFGIISATICHNDPGVGSRKLYYYDNSNLFYCYSGCEDPCFDIFQLVIKVMEIQKHQVLNLNDAIRWIAQKFNISGKLEETPEVEELDDWKYLSNYDRIQDIEIDTSRVVLKEYDIKILSRFNYKVKIEPWLKENISQDVMDRAFIGYYPGGDQITIPHFDVDGRFIGLRGRALSAEDAEKYGKYRPLKINQQLYSHPLGMNLYGLNWNKEHIRVMKKAIIVESEKSVLKFASYYGWENNICVACCGSTISSHQIRFLLDLGVEEIIIGFDKQYKELNTDESKTWKNKLLKIYNKYHQYCLISFIWDKKNLLGYKDSPLDRTADIFLQLFKERIVL